MSFLSLYFQFFWFAISPSVLFSFFFPTELQLIYNIVLVLGVQQSDSDIYIHIYMAMNIYIYILFFRFFSIIGYYKILNTVLCAIQ